MSRTFGCTSTSSGTGVAMVINSVTKRTSAEIAEARGTTGKVTDQQAYSREQAHSVSGLVDGSHSIKAGASATIAGLTAILTEANLQETNTGYQTCDMANAKKDNATQVAYSS